MEIRESTILITGASQGLGRALAIHLAGQGARLLLAARNELGLQETHEQIAGRDSSSSVHAFALDLSRLGSVRALVQSVEREGLAVDILINNAADVTSKPLLDTECEEINRLVRTNVSGPLQLTRLLLPGMIARKRGMIVNISSLAGYKANPAQTVYSITKSAVNGMSRALAAELRGTPVRVMNVALSSVGEGEGQVFVEHYAVQLTAAIQRDAEELFLSSKSKWLMRAYRAFPGLEKLKG